MYIITQEMKNKIQEMDKKKFQTMGLFEKSHSSNSTLVKKK